MNAVRRTAQTLHICWNPRHFRPQALTLQYSTSLYLYTLQQQYCTGNNNTVIERWMKKKNLYCIVQWSWICCLNWENVLYWKRYWQTRTSVHPVQWLCTHTVKCSRLKQVLHLPQETVAYTGALCYPRGGSELCCSKKIKKNLNPDQKVTEIPQVSTNQILRIK